MARVYTKSCEQDGIESPRGARKKAPTGCNRQGPRFHSTENGPAYRLAHHGLFACVRASALVSNRDRIHEQHIFDPLPGSGGVQPVFR